MTERLGSLFSSAYGAVLRMGKAGALAIGLALPACAEEITVVALGDSLTQGFGLVEEQGLVPQLEGWLEARGHDVPRSRTTACRATRPRAGWRGSAGRWAITWTL